MHQELFKTFRTFYKNRQIVRQIYEKLDMKSKLELKRYIYSNTLIIPYHKDLIWEYLNEPKGSPFYVFNNTLRKQYGKAKI